MYVWRHTSCVRHCTYVGWRGGEGRIEYSPMCNHLLWDSVCVRHCTYKYTHTTTHCAYVWWRGGQGRIEYSPMCNHLLWDSVCEQQLTGWVKLSCGDCWGYPVQDLVHDSSVVTVVPGLSCDPPSPESPGLVWTGVAHQTTIPTPIGPRVPIGWTFCALFNGTKNDGGLCVKCATKSSHHIFFRESQDCWGLWIFGVYQD